MDVPVSAFRAELKSWIEAARNGEDVVVTDRGVPVARLSGVASADLLTRLQRDGLVEAPSADRSTADVGAPTRPSHVPGHERGAHVAGSAGQALSELARRLRR